jgi:hypothetical protein
MADFRAVYHIGWAEALALPGPEFFILAARLPNYPGVMKLRAEHEAAKQEKQERRNVRNADARLVDLNDPALAGLIQIG